MKRIFICAPFIPTPKNRDAAIQEVGENLGRMEEMCELLISLGNIPIAPDLFMNLMDISDECREQQVHGWISCAEEFWIVGRRVTKDMVSQIQTAVDLKIPIHCVNDPEAICFKLLNDVFSVPYDDDDCGEEM